MLIEPSSEFHGVHVVVFPFPAQGHTGPAFQLSKILARYGVTVTFVSVTPSLASARQILFEDPGFQSRNMIRLVALDVPEELCGRDFTLAKFHDLRLITDNMNGVFEDLIRSLVESAEASELPGPPTCIISDMFLGWTQDIANKFQIPRYCLFSSPALFLSLMCHLPSFEAQGLIPVKSDAKPLIIPGFPPIMYGDLADSLLETGIKKNRDFLVYHSKRLLEAAGILVNSVYEVEYEVIEGLRNTLSSDSKLTQVPSVLTIGPLMDGINSGIRENITKVTPKGDECLEWLNRHPPSSVLYIAFGTVALLTATQIDQLALGLEASGQRFLWVLRAPAITQGSESIPQVWDFLPAGFVERTKDRGLVFSNWAPQLHILGHPAVGAFLTHCGWNSAMESILIGVPMIAWPMIADQMMNARLIVDVRKIGVGVHRQGYGAHALLAKEEIERAIRLLMQDEHTDGVRKKVGEASRTVERAVAVGGSSHTNLHLFLNSLRPTKH